MASQIDETYDSSGSSVVAVRQVYPHRIMNRPAHNDLFTGREVFLDEIHRRLTHARPASITQRQAINGLGGIGKTQLAIEYTYRYESDYRQIFWVNAESRDTIIQEYVKMAQALALPESNEQNQQVIVAAVMQWLETYEQWLLILDNADDLEMVQDYIPDAMKGHVLLTTRAQALGRLAESVPIDYMTLKEGAHFLLHRAGKTGQQEAEALVQALGGLPLALDQAGAYIEETGESVANYLHIYQGLGVKLLNDRRGIRRDHPQSVVKTFLLAFTKVEQSNETAVNLLRLCAFFAAEDIPEYLITTYFPQLIIATTTTQQASQARPRFNLWSSGKQPPATAAESQDTLNNAFAALFKLSLIGRANGVVSIHRLVQAVLKEDMIYSTQHRWANVAIRIMNAAFPNAADESTWFSCEQLLTHALSCVQLIIAYTFTSPEASQLLNNVGVYLTGRARYAEAQPLLERAKHLREDAGEKSPLFAESLHNLAVLYERQDKYAQAEQLLTRALRIREKELAKDHPDTAKSLNSLVQLLRKRNKLAEAEPLVERALEINRNKLGFHHPDTLQSLKNLATLYVDQQKYAEAEGLYQQALDYSKEKPGSNLITAGIMQDLADLYKRQDRLAEAENLYTEALRIRKEKLGEAPNPEIATTLNSMAELRDLQGKPQEAEQLYKDALTMREQMGRESTGTASSLYSLAGFHKRQGNLVQAEQYYKSARAIWEKKLGLNNPLTMQVQDALVQLYEEQHRDDEAEAVLKRGLNLRFQKLRPDDPTITQNLQALSAFYIKRSNAAKLEQLLEQAFDERSRKLSIYHPLASQALVELLKHYRSQKKNENIERLLWRVFVLRSQSLKGDRPETRQGFEQILQELTRLYEAKKSLAEKEQLYRQAVDVCYEKLGQSDPLSRKCFDELMHIWASQGDNRSREEAKKRYYQEFERRRHVLITGDPTSIHVFLDDQHKFADFFEQQKNYEDAEQVLEQTLETSYKNLGIDNPRTIQELHSLVQLYESHRKVAEGIRLYIQDVKICKHANLEKEHPRMIESNNNLARFYLKHRKYEDAESIVEEMKQQCEPKLADNYVPFDRKSLSKEYILAAVHSLLNAAKLYSENYTNKDKQRRADELFRKALKVSMEKLDEAAQNEARESRIEFLTKQKRFEEAAALRINAKMMKKQENGQQE